MAADQLPAAVGEFARYLDGLLARLDPSGGWCAVFWQRDPEGMRACLDGREMPPWDMVEALLQDLAGVYGPAGTGPETDRARTLHAAALAAYDARPGGRDALGDRLDVMLREQRYAAERRAALARHLTSATTPEQADALRVALAWAQDDHERADARCAELRSRMAQADRREQGMPFGTRGDGDGQRGGAGPDSAVATRPRRAMPDSPVPAAPGAYDATALEAGGRGRRQSASGPGPSPGETAEEVVPGAFAASGEWRAPEGAASRGGGGGGAEGGAPEAFGTSTRWHAPRRAASPGRPGEGVPAGAADDALGVPATAAPDVFGGRAAAAPDVFGGRAEVDPGVPGGRAAAAPDVFGGRAAAAPDVPRGRTVVTPDAPGGRGAATAGVHRVPAAPGPRAFTAQTPEPPAAAPPAQAPPVTAPPALHTPAPAPPAPAPPALHAPAPAPPAPGPPPPAPPPPAPPPPAPPAPSPRAPHPRKRRRGSARFAGMGDEEAVPVVEAPVAVPSPPATAPVATGRTPRGARYAGVGEEEVVVERPAPEADRARQADPAEVGRTVEVLARLRSEGRSGEAHALLAEIASWEPGRFPLLAERLRLAGLDADWQTLLWEAAALPAGRLVAAADALVAAGRPEDGRQMLRQGVARPPAELGRAVLGLVAEGRDREVRVLLDAYVRARTPEEAARSAEPDPGRLVPLLLEAAGGVSQERRWDLVHALRVAGFAV
ncbi:hypothetical protein AB0K68_09845 [Streptomyces sp. NPDC050698]